MEHTLVSTLFVSVDSNLPIPFKKSCDSTHIRFSGRGIDKLRDQLEEIVKDRRDYCPTHYSPHRQCHRLNEAVIEEFLTLRKELIFCMDKFEGYRVAIERESKYRVQLTLEQRATALYLKIRSIASAISSLYDYDLRRFHLSSSRRTRRGTAPPEPRQARSEARRSRSRKRSLTRAGEARTGGPVEGKCEPTENRVHFGKSPSDAATDEFSFKLELLE